MGSAASHPWEHGIPGHLPGLLSLSYQPRIRSAAQQGGWQHLRFFWSDLKDPRFIRALLLQAPHQTLPSSSRGWSHPEQSRLLGCPTGHQNSAVAFGTSGLVWVQILEGSSSSHREKFTSAPYLALKYLQRFSQAALLRFWCVKCTKFCSLSCTGTAHLCIRAASSISG